ncbi:hypothetical protein M0Q50_03505 [bacterium]|jgi:hypothetical protein|nr:hypothetical protein [bacterium]
MGILKKIISIDDVKLIPHNTSFGIVELYPNGTKRTIKKLTFSGYKIFNQISNIESDNDSETYIYFNRWKNVDKTDNEIKFDIRLKKVNSL